MMDYIHQQPIITVTGPSDENNQKQKSNSNSCFKTHSTNECDLTANCSSANMDITDELPTAFVRSSYRDTAFDPSPSKLSRLSIAIRRSLRLGLKRGTAFDSSQKKKLLQDKSTLPFTEFTDLRPEIFIEPQFGTIEEVDKLVQNKQWNRLKTFLRENDWPVTHEIRKDLWRILVSTNDKEFVSRRHFYLEQIETMLKSKVQNFRPAFLSESGIVVCDHGLKEIGVINLQRLLIVIEYARPEIRFVPVLYPLCAVFLHYQSVDEAFACVSSLLAQGNKFILQSELAVYASRYTLLVLLKKFKRKVYNKLQKRIAPDKSKLTELMANWHLWIFKCLPFPYLVRLIDCFLLEGQKMLTRAVIALLYLWYKQNGIKRASSRILLTKPTESKKCLLTEDRISELNAEICSVTSKMPVSVQTFLDIAFSIRRLSKNTIVNYQQHYENKLREVVSKLRSAKNARQPEERIYTLAFISKIIDEDAARELMSALPARFQLETPTILFRLSEHGTSFVQLWFRIEEAEQSILIIRSTEKHIFGAYLSSSWAERKDVRERAKTRYFGTGESFVWRLDEEIKLPVIYTWTEQLCDNYFMAANDKFMIIGSGGGDAIAIRDELVEGSSQASSTFQSPELVPGGHFQINELEVWSIPSSR